MFSTILHILINLLSIYIMYEIKILKIVSNASLFFNEYHYTFFRFKLTLDSTVIQIMRCSTLNSVKNYNFDKCS